MMQGPERYCKNCGHRCHCYQPDCDECVNDVCTKCDCEEKKSEPLPHSDARDWGDYLK